MIFLAILLAGDREGIIYLTGQRAPSRIQRDRLGNMKTHCNNGQLHPCGVGVGRCESVDPNKLVYVLSQQNRGRWKVVAVLLIAKRSFRVG